MRGDAHRNSKWTGSKQEAESPPYLHTLCRLHVGPLLAGSNGEQRAKQKWVLQRTSLSIAEPGVKE